MMMYRIIALPIFVLQAVAGTTEQILKYPLVLKYTEMSSEYLGQLVDLKSGRSTTSDECVPNAIWIGSRAAPITRVREMHLNGVRVFDFTESYVVKVLRESASPFEEMALVNEKVVLETLEDAYFAEIVRSEPEMSPFCKTRMFVRRQAGLPLEDPAIVMPFLLQPQSVFGVAAKGLRLLEKFHKSGLVHGDINWGNLLMTNRGDVLQLIDFRASAPFTDEFGNHINAATTRDIPTFQSRLAFLSTWHLLSGRVDAYHQTRRDDFFRLAEMLLMMTSMQYMTRAVRLVGRSASAEEWAQMKLSYDDLDTPQQLKDFYMYALSLGYESQPNYAAWIAFFDNM